MTNQNEPIQPLDTSHDTSRLSGTTPQQGRRSKFTFEELLNHDLSKLALATIANPSEFGFKSNVQLTQSLIKATFPGDIKSSTLQLRLADLVAEGVLNRAKDLTYSLTQLGRDLMTSEYGRIAHEFAQKKKLGSSVDERPTSLQTEEGDSSTQQVNSQEPRKTLADTLATRSALVILAIIAEPTKFGLATDSSITSALLATVFPHAIKRSIISDRLKVLTDATILERTSGGSYLLSAYGRELFNDKLRQPAGKAVAYLKLKQPAAAHERVQSSDTALLVDIEKSNPALAEAYRILARNPTRTAVLIKGMAVAETSVRGALRLNPIESALKIKNSELRRHIQGLREQKLIDHRDKPTPLAHEWKQLHEKLNATRSDKPKQDNEGGALSDASARPGPKQRNTPKHTTHPEEAPKTPSETVSKSVSEKVSKPDVPEAPSTQPNEAAGYVTSLYPAPLTSRPSEDQGRAARPVISPKLPPLINSVRTLADSHREFVEAFNSASLRQSDRAMLSQAPLSKAKELLPAAILLGSLDRIFEQPVVQAIVGSPRYSAAAEGLDIALPLNSSALHDLFTFIHTNQAALPERFVVRPLSPASPTPSFHERCDDLVTLLSNPQLGLLRPTSSLRGFLSTLRSELVSIENTVGKTNESKLHMLSRSARTAFRSGIGSILHLDSADSFSRMAARGQDNPVTLAARLVVAVDEASNADLIHLLNGVLCSESTSEVITWAETSERVTKALRSCGVSIPSIAPYRSVKSDAVASSLRPLTHENDSSIEHFLESIESPGVALRVLTLPRAPYFKMTEICISKHSTPSAIISLLEHFEREKLRVFENNIRFPELTTSIAKLPHGVEFSHSFIEPKSENSEVIVSNGRLRSWEHISEARFLIRYSHQPSSKLIDLDFISSESSADTAARTQLRAIQDYNLSVLAQAKLSENFSLLVREESVTSSPRPLSISEDPAQRESLDGWLESLAESLERGALHQDFLPVLAGHPAPRHAQSLLRAAEGLSAVLDDLSRLSATGVQYPLALELRNGELAIRVKTNQPEHLHALIEGNGALETVSKPSSPIPQQPAAQARLIRELIQSLAVSGLTNAGIIELKRSMLHLEELQFNGKIDHTILQDAMLASRHALKRSGKISSDTSDIAAFLGSIDIECALAAPRILGAQPSEQSIERLRNNLLLLRANGLSHVPLESVNKVNLNKLWSEGQTRFLNQSVVLDPQFTRYVLTNVPLNSFAPLPEEISYIAHSDETLLIDMTWNLTRGALGPRLNSIYLGEHTKPADIANALSLYHQSVFDNFTRLMNEQPELMLPVINQFRQSPTVPTFRPGDRVNSSFSGFPDDANTLWVTDGTPILNKDDLGHHRASIEHGSFTLLVVRHPLSEMARVIRGDQHVQTTPTSKHVVSSGPIYEALGQILSTNYLKSKEILAVVQGEQQHG